MKKSAIKRTRLTLSRETIRELDTPDLSRVAGGMALTYQAAACTTPTVDILHGCTSDMPSCYCTPLTN